MIPQHVNPGGDDTIVALSTAQGRSAVAVIRMSGPSAFAIAERVLTPWPLVPRRSTLCKARDPVNQSVIDELLVTVFQGPGSYTGEDTVEFSTHGGYVVPEALMRALLHAGARQALAGEFTRRAVLNGKLDLLQAEAIGDLIDASSEAMRRLALHQLDGGLSRQIAELRGQLLDVEALLAYDIDFPEEDTGPISHSAITVAASGVCDALDALLGTAPVTELVREGALIVIAGRPNVGKSSLFNALLGETRAIVTEIPGTTRDAIEARIDLGRWPARIVDTAGLRTTADVVEQLGIEVSQRYLAHAQGVLLCEDEPSLLAASLESMRAATVAPVVPVLTKRDELSWGAAEVHGCEQLPAGALPVSARTRRGLAELTAHLEGVLSDHYGMIPVEQPALTRTRQRVSVERARDEMERFRQLWASAELPTSIAAVHVRAAVGALEELIGTVDVEDVLGRLFATFCVGK